MTTSLFPSLKLMPFPAEECVTGKGCVIISFYPSRD